MNRLSFLSRYKYTPLLNYKYQQYIQQVPVNYYSIVKKESNENKNEIKYSKFNEKTYIDYNNYNKWNKQINTKDKTTVKIDDIDYDIVLGLDFPSSRFSK